MEVDVDSSGTVDFYEFLCVARLIAQGKGLYTHGCQGQPEVSSKRARAAQFWRETLEWLSNTVDCWDPKKFRVNEG